MDLELTYSIHPLFEGLDHSDRLFSDNLFRMGREGEHDGDEVVLFGFTDERFQNFLMTEMNTVEVTESDSGFLRKDGKIFEALNNVHELREK